MTVAARKISSFLSIDLKLIKTVTSKQNLLQVTTKSDTLTIKWNKT